MGPVLDGEGVADGAGAAAAAADEGDLDRVVFRAWTMGTAMPARAVATATRPLSWKKVRREGLRFGPVIGSLAFRSKCVWRGVGASDAGVTLF